MMPVFSWRRLAFLFVVFCGMVPICFGVVLWQVIWRRLCVQSIAGSSGTGKAENERENKMESNMNDAIMQICNLNVSYDGKTVLHNVSMNIRRNRIAAILGTSGCGKTTFLKTLNGLLEQERGVNVSGRIMLEEADIHGRVEKKCGTGVSDTGTVSVFYL